MKLGSKYINYNWARIDKKHFCTGLRGQKMEHQGIYRQRKFNYVLDDYYLKLAE